MKQVLGVHITLCFILLSAYGFSTEPAIPEHFKSFAPLIGKQWVAQFPGGGSDTQMFEWVYEGKFLRNSHFVKNAEGKKVYEGETIFAWDFKEKKVAWWYWNTTGGHIIGIMWPEDGKLIFEGENNAPGGQTSKVRGAFLMSKDTWTSVQYFWKDGAWVKQGEMSFKAL